jgi:hypothetical protein
MIFRVEFPSERILKMWTMPDKRFGVDDTGNGLYVCPSRQKAKRMLSRASEPILTDLKKGRWR